MKASKLNTTRPFRGILAGYPGAGKTGALVSLLEAGYKVRMLDFDGNHDPLLKFASPEALERLDIVELQDKYRAGDKHMELDGIPNAFATGLKMMSRWKYKDGEEEVDLGASKDWGPDTVVVVDSATKMGEAAKNRILQRSNKPQMTKQLWGLAASDFTRFIDLLASPDNKFHLIILAHLQLVGPDTPEVDDDTAVKDAKRAAAELIPTRIYPRAVTKNSSTTFAGLLPTTLLVERRIWMGKTKRVIVTETGAEFDAKLPAKVKEKEYPIETGLLDIFKALGHKPPKG